MNSYYELIWEFSAIELIWEFSAMKKIVKSCLNSFK